MKNHSGKEKQQPRCVQEPILPLAMKEKKILVHSRSRFYLGFLRKDSRILRGTPRQKTMSNVSEEDVKKFAAVGYAKQLRVSIMQITFL